MRDLIFRHWNMKDKKDIIKFFLEKNVLVSKPFIERMVQEEVDIGKFYETSKHNIINNPSTPLNDHLNTFLGRGGEHISTPSTLSLPSTKVQIVSSYEIKTKKWKVQDFVSLFNKRFDALEKPLRNRTELQNLLSINRIKQKREKDNISIIGIVTDKRYTKNGNILLEVEDRTGIITVLANKNKQDIFDDANDIVLDEVIGITGVNGDNIIFANNIIWPDIPQRDSLKKSPDDVYVAFISDIHVGSDHFLGEELMKFINWLKGEVGSEQQRILAKKIKYIFVIGDLVDGCGIYPGQENELLIPDIYDQYKECARFLKEIPPDIHLIICPGNHDAVRLEEPQPVLHKDLSKPIWDLPNVYMVSNPAIVNIHSSESFSGFDVLMYHGYSFDHLWCNCRYDPLNSFCHIFRDGYLYTRFWI